jgi:hypothetical protein
MELPLFSLIVDLKIPWKLYSSRSRGTKRVLSRSLFRGGLCRNKEPSAHRPPAFLQPQQSADHFAKSAVRSEDCSARNLISEYMFRNHATGDIS